MLVCDDYVSAGSLAEAFAAMAASGGRARYVAGATDLLPWARQGRAGDAHIPVLIDVTGIEELRARTVDGGRIRLGAATKLQRFLDDPALMAAMPEMRHCAVWFADDQIRSSATLGGNLVNASPAADSAPPLLAHDAEVEIAGWQDGAVARRRMPLAQFLCGPGRTALAPGEILVAVECDALSGYGGAFEKVGHRRSLVISVACVAAAVSLAPDRRHFDDVRLAAGGIGPVPVRLADVEALLRGAPIDAPTLDEAARLPLHLIQSRTRQAYRRSVLHGFLIRALDAAARAAGADVAALSDELEASYG